jgi:hypothetical protein
MYWRCVCFGGQLDENSPKFVKSSEFTVAIATKDGVMEDHSGAAGVAQSAVLAILRGFHLD